MSALLCALAAVWLAAAVHLFGDPCGPAALLPALMLGAGAAALRRSGSVVPAQIALGAALAGALLMHFFFPPVELPFARLAGYRAFAVFGLVLAAAYLCLHLRASLQRARFLLLVAGFLVLAIAASPSWSWVGEALELAAAALLLGRLATPTAELAAALLLFAAALGSSYGPVAAAVLVVWSAVLVAQRGAAWTRVAAPLSGAAYCVAASFLAQSVCEVPALGIGLFCAAAAVEGAA